MELLDVAKMLFALLFTLALIGGAAWLARRFGMIDIAARPGAPERRLKVVESLMLDPRRRLVVVRFDAQEHLLLLSPAGDSAITSAPVALPAEVQS